MCFPRAVDRQDLRCRVNLQRAVAARQPVADGLPQFRFAQRAGVARQTGEAGRQGILDQLRCRVARLADAQADGLVSGVWRDAGVQQAQPLERVGLEVREQGIHAGDYLAIVF